MCCVNKGEILFLCLLHCLLFMLDHCSSFTRLSWTLILTYGSPSTPEWTTNAVSKHCLLPCMSLWKIPSIRGPQACLCGALLMFYIIFQTISTVSQPAAHQTYSSFIQTRVSPPVTIKVLYKIMLEASLNGDTWRILHLSQLPSLLSYPWRRLMWFVDE